MKELSLVSIIMNCYNGEKYLSEAIDSVLSQTYNNWEIIFWDNQSTDQSAEIVKRYDDPRIRYIYAPRHTLLYEARNYAIANASGEFIAFLDVDDWWHEQKLEKQLTLFKDSDVGFVSSKFHVFNQANKKFRLFNKKKIHTGYVLDEILKDYQIGLLTLIIRRSSMNELIGPCNPNYHIIGDFDLSVRLALKWKFDCVQESLAYFRFHGNNESSRNRDLLVKELKHWESVNKNNECINNSLSFKFFSDKYTYIEIVDYLIAGQKKKAVSLIPKVISIHMRLKLF